MRKSMLDRIRRHMFTSCRVYQLLVQTMRPSRIVRIVRNQFIVIYPKEEPIKNLHTTRQNSIQNKIAIASWRLSMNVFTFPSVRTPSAIPMYLLEFVEYFLLHGSLLVCVRQEMMSMFDEESDGPSLERDFFESAVRGRWHQSLPKNPAQIR